MLRADILCNGYVQIDGEVWGNVSCGILVVGAKGRLHGDASAENVNVSGRIHGVIEAGKVKLNPGCFVVGTINTASLDMKAGASFESTERIAIADELKVDGNLTASIHGTRLVISRTGRIDGDITVDELTVDGEVHGTIRGRSVLLGPHARVFGDVFHASLSLSRGAFFEGKARRSDDPLAVPAP